MPREENKQQVQQQGDYWNCFKGEWTIQKIILGTLLLVGLFWLCRKLFRKHPKLISPHQDDVIDSNFYFM
jgi:hypothetical protein